MESFGECGAGCMARFHPQDLHRVSSDDAEPQLVSLTGSDLTLWGAIQVPLRLFPKISGSIRAY